MVKRVFIISIFIIFPFLFPLFAMEWEGTKWLALSESDSMEALLVIELNPGGLCLTTHAYLRKGEEIPFEKKTVKENWYYDGRKRLFLMDNWGEFASFLWEEENGRLVTTIGREEIIMTPLSEQRWEELKDYFSLNSGQ